MPKKNRGEEGSGIEMLGAMVPSLIPLTLKLGRTYLRFKKDAQKASRIFEKELRVKGIDKNTAKEMTEIYLSSSRILRAFDFSNMIRYNQT